MNDFQEFDGEEARARVRAAQLLKLEGDHTFKLADDAQQTDEACDLYTRTVELYKQALVGSVKASMDPSDLLFVCTLHLNIATVALRIADFHQALTHSQESVRVAHELLNHTDKPSSPSGLPPIANCYQFLGISLARLGRSDGPKGGITALKKALTYCDQNKPLQEEIQKFLSTLRPISYTTSGSTPRTATGGLTVAPPKPAQGGASAETLESKAPPDATQAISFAANPDHGEEEKAVGAGEAAGMGVEGGAAASKASDEASSKPSA